MIHNNDIKYFGVVVTRTVNRTTINDLSGNIMKIRHNKSLNIKYEMQYMFFTISIN